MSAEKVSVKLKEFKPIVVFISGSVGKSSTRSYFEEILKSRYKYLSAEISSNSLDLFLKEIDRELKAEHVFLLVEFSPYSEKMVGEALKILKPQLLIVTNINEAHLLEFEDIRGSYSSLLRNFNSDGVVVLNADDPELVGLAAEIKSKKLFYGVKEKADVSASDIKLDVVDTSYFLSASFPGLSSGRTRITNSLLGLSGIYNGLAAAAAALSVGISLSKVKESLAVVKPLKGRLTMLRGLNGCALIDDTFSSSPYSAVYSLDVLRTLKGKRKIAVIGEITDLGSFEDTGYRMIGKKAAGVGLHTLVIVGNRAGPIADAFSVDCIAFGAVPHIVRYDSSEEAVTNIIERLDPSYDDIILINGCLKGKMNKITEALLADKNQLVQS